MISSPGVGVLDHWRFRAEVDARLDHFVAGDAEIVLLQIGAPESRRLLHPPARAAAVDDDPTQRDHQPPRAAPLSESHPS